MGSKRESMVAGKHKAELTLGLLQPDEHDVLYELFRQIVEAGEGFPHEPPLTLEAFNAAWTGPTSTVVAARMEGDLAGAYYLKPNFPGRAAHIANAGYIVSEAHRGRGVGRAMVKDSIQRAPLLGFDAIQFNLVFESNPARALYEELGWREIGRVPNAVGGEEAVIYWRGIGA